MLNFLHKVFSRFFGRPPKNSGEPDFRSLAENSSDVIIRVGPDGAAYYVSPSSKRVFGWNPEEIIGSRPETFVAPEDVAVIDEVLRGHFSGTFGSDRVEFRMQHRNGYFIWVEARYGPVVNEMTGTPEVVVTMRDIDAQKALEHKLKALAHTDSLTGLANRRAFDKALEMEWQRAKQEAVPLSFLLIDVDRYKRFNDRYGHQAGDDCLRAIAAAINLEVRPGDLVARYGGEEIAIILYDTDQNASLKLGEAVRTSIARLGIPHAGNLEAQGIVTVSVGVATALSHAGGSEHMPAGLLQAADIALYKAKSKGRNRVEAALILTSTGQISSAA